MYFRFAKLRYNFNVIKRSYYLYGFRINRRNVLSSHQYGEALIVQGKTLHRRKYLSSSFNESEYSVGEYEDKFQEAGYKIRTECDATHNGIRSGCGYAKPRHSLCVAPVGAC